MEFSDIALSDEFRQLEIRESKLKELKAAYDEAAAIGFASDSIKQAYEQAIDELEADVAKAASEPNLQNMFASLGEAGLAGLDQIEPLVGVIPEVEIMSLKGEHWTRYFRAEQFFKSHDAISDEAKLFARKMAAGGFAVQTSVGTETVEETEASVTQEGPVAESGQLSAESLSERHPLTITVSHGIVRVGKSSQGRPFKTTSLRGRAGDRDYSNERIESLVTLADADGEWVSVAQLKEAMGHPDMSSNNFAIVRTWLLNLAYKRRGIIETTGKGPATKYRFTPKYKPVVVRKQSLPAETDTSQEEKFSNCDVWVVVNHLNNQYLRRVAKEKLGIAVSDDLLEQLSEYMPKRPENRNNDEAIWEGRRRAADRIGAAITDDEIWFEYLSSTSEDHPAYRFVDSLIGLSQEQKSLLKRLMGSEAQSEPSLDGGFRIWVVERGSGNIVTYQDVPPRTPSKPEDETASESVEELTPGATVDLRDEAETTPLAQEVKTGGHRNEKKAKFDKTELAKLSFLETVAFGSALTLLEHFTLDGTYTRPQIHAFFPKFTANRVATAKDNRVVSNERHKNFTIEEAVRIIVYTDRDLQNVYTNRKYKQVVQDIIKRAIEKAAAQVERQMQPED